MWTLVLRTSKRYGTTVMSAPTPAPGDESPREGYYPDPSIPGYVRYWNGASWVPGTSRPAPRQDGTTPATPPAPAADAAPQRQAPVDETGPMYLDEVEGTDAPAPDGGSAGGEADVTPGQASAGDRLAGRHLPSDRLRRRTRPPRLVGRQGSAYARGAPARIRDTGRLHAGRLRPCRGPRRARRSAAARRPGPDARCPARHAGRQRRGERRHRHHPQGAARRRRRGPSSADRGHGHHPRGRLRRTPPAPA